MPVAAKKVESPAVAPKGNGIASFGGVAYLDNVTTQWEYITPDVAQKYLAKMGRNRNLMERLVLKYATDLDLKFWPITHQGIAFSVDDKLVDGQHRLNAIILADKPVYMLVTRGLTEEAMEAIDRGKMRTLAHALQITGHTLSSARAVAIARRMAFGPAMIAGWKEKMITEMQLRSFLDLHTEAILFSLETCPSSTGPATLGAVFGRAYYHVSLDELRRFAEAMLDHIPLDQQREGDKAARRVKQLSGQTGGQSMIIAYYRKAQNGLRHYLDNTPIKQLCEISDDLFPLPKGTDIHSLQASVQKEESE